MKKARVVVGGAARDDAKAFLDAWHRAERGERFSEVSLSFESWEALAAVMSKERLRLLRHVRRHPQPSVKALAESLGRQYRRVHEDVSVLADAGLLDRSGGRLRATAGRIEAVIEL